MNMVYNASAGTGKTYQVTHLYEKLVLEEGIDPRNILLMTFTDNAAAELRLRVSHRFLKARRTAEADGSDDLAERAITASAHLPSAPIGTIHSFCARLLREHALEAGLSPGFSSLVGDERDELLNRICRDELLTQLDTDPHFKTFCSGAHIIGTSGGFGTSITETVPKLIAQAGSLGISLEKAEAMLPAPLPPISIIELDSIRKQLADLPKRSKKVEEALQTLSACLEKSDDPATVIDLFSQSFSGHFSFGDAKTIYPRFKELKEEIVDRALYRQRHPAARAFARYVQNVARAFQRSKHEMDAVDFDDQLQMAAALLQSGKAEPAFSHIIVDEVQDTSRIQCNLIESLWAPDRNLIICGDKKQSIYTWRGADPQVMPDLEQRILDAGGTRENLQTSYRSKGPVLDVVNQLFSSVYDEADYTAADQLETNPAFATANEKACIEYLAPDTLEEDAAKPDKVAAEMAAVANRIQLLVNGAPEWQPAYRYADGFEPTTSSNRYRYSDILILLRRTTHQSALEQALRHAGIPYTLGGRGRGLFTRQETRDVSLFLNVVTNPADAWSLIGFLRSPWVGLSDEAIAELAWSEAGFSVDQLQKNASGATDIIDRYREQLGTKLSSELVRMLIDETGYDALLAGRPRGTQRLANLRKILDWLREHERGARTTPAAVARKLAEQISNPPNIPEAALLDPAQNAVTVMTVHGSKGLTQRVVVLPDISAQPNADRSFAQVFFNEKQTPTLGLKITAPDKSGVSSPGFKAAGQRARSVRDHELKNLFYVAMTRARDLVITSASIGKKPDGWLAQMEPLIGKAIPEIPYSLLSSAAEHAPPPNREQPTASHLAGALQGLLPPPAPPTLERIPATRLAKEQDRQELVFDDERPAVRPLDRAAAMGSLGHAVLEQLAHNDWDGSAAEWLEKLRGEFGLEKAEALKLQVRIEQTCRLMRNVTAGTIELRPELPFVLHDGDRLIDGTIDLLCRTPDGFAIFDYKFSEAGDSALLEQYCAQMAIYRTAAERMFRYAAEASLQLIAVSASGARVVPVDF